ncbi:MAG: hypothetical protein QOJ15_3372, partial [Bradyrhizobium sp.]|nr:hypothetical protein [Bradyrhizobium sp.]
MNRWDETWQRLRTWTAGQGPSERLSAQVLTNDGFLELDPSHPLGGKDGKRDAICTKDGIRWVMAVYFPRDQQDFTTIKTKFSDDLKGIIANDAGGIAFVTNQELRLDERKQLKELAVPFEVEIYHLERVTMILDKPEMASVRKQFLNIGDDIPTLLMAGGGGGLAPGAGGGGGAALAAGAFGGTGGRGGNIRLEGQPGQTPGAGGGGAGAIGDNAIGAEGGGGGELVIGVFRAGDLPPSIEITIGEGGKGGAPGQPGQDGGDTSFGKLLRARGGQGGQVGRSTSTRAVTHEDVKSGLRVCGAYLTECAHVKNGLLYLLSAGWENFSV